MKQFLWLQNSSYECIRIAYCNVHTYVYMYLYVHIHIHAVRRIGNAGIFGSCLFRCFFLVVLSCKYRCLLCKKNAISLGAKRDSRPNIQIWITLSNLKLSIYNAKCLALLNCTCLLHADVTLVRYPNDVLFISIYYMYICIFNAIWIVRLLSLL